MLFILNLHDETIPIINPMNPQYFQKAGPDGLLHFFYGKVLFDTQVIMFDEANGHIVLIPQDQHAQMLAEARPETLPEMPETFKKLLFVEFPLIWARALLVAEGIVGAARMRSPEPK